MNGFCPMLLLFLATFGVLMPSPSSISRRENVRQAPEDSSSASGISVQLDCLPEGVKASDVAAYREKSKGSDRYITIEDKLVELKAHCAKGKLVDGKEREIRFFKFACFGNPPADFEELRQKELQELEKLRKNYCVLVIECDPRIS